MAVAFQRFLVGAALLGAASCSSSSSKPARDLSVKPDGARDAVVDLTEDSASDLILDQALVDGSRFIEGTAGRDHSWDRGFDGPASKDTSATQVWSKDFAIQTVDPAGDDTGDGHYTYPKGVTAGSADLRSFDLTYTATVKRMDITVGLTQVTEATRVGVMLLDQTGFQSAQRDWTIGGVEIRTPLWNRHGVSLVVGLPEASSTLFDYSVKNANPQGEARPDNAIYVFHNPTQWLDKTGYATQSVTNNIKRLDVAASRSATPQTLKFSVNVEELRNYIDLASPKLYAIVYAYLVVDTQKGTYKGFMEYGGFEVSEEEGATANWEDCDAYDIGFTKPGDQSKLLTVTGTGEAAVVVLSAVGSGVLEIVTQ